MYHFLKKYRNRLLAIATAFLMVAFLLPTMRSGRGGSDPVVGHAYGEKLHMSDLKRSQFYWNELSRGIFTPDQRPLGSTLGQEAFFAMSERPELFLLLSKEAMHRGIYVSDEAVREQAKQMLTPGTDMRKPMEARQVYAAMRELMMIQESFLRTMSAVRVSEPMRKRELAAQLQEMRLTVADFPAAEFYKQVGQPSKEELQKLFDQYKDTLPILSGMTPKENPFGLGYRLPNRAQIQFISVAEDDVRRVVDATRTPERWRIDARIYYSKNPNVFSSTTKPAGATQPVATTQPFEQVSEKAIEAVIRPEIDKTMAAIVSRINSTVAGDWGAYRASKDNAKSSLGVPFDSYEYLQHLAASIQKEFGVLPTLGASGGLLADYEMAQLGPIAQSRTSAGIPFSSYAVMTEAQRRELISRIPTLPPTLDMFQPSQSMRDSSNNVYLFRRSGFDPAHTPKDISEVAARVEKDWQRVKTFEMAQQAADKFVAAAKEKGLDQAAKDTGRKLVTTGFIPSDQGLAMGLHLTDAGTPIFVSRAISRLLEDRAAGDAKPIAAIPVEQDGRVVVARMDELKSNYHENLAPLYTSMIDRRLMSEMAGPIVSTWFSYDAVAKRTDYKPEFAEKKKETQDESSPKTPAAPLSPLGF